LHAMAQEDARDPWWTPVPLDLGPAPKRAALTIAPDDLDVSPEVAAALRDAPDDDEPISEEEERAVAESREWFKHNPGIPFEQVVAELGFTMEEVKNYREPG